MSLMKHNLLIKSSVSESSLSSLENSDEPEDVETNAEVSMKQKRKRKASDDDFSVPTSPRKKRAIKLEPVYIIPDIARKETKFRGRLGEFLEVAWFIFADPNRIRLLKHRAAKQKTCK